MSQVWVTATVLQLLAQRGLGRVGATFLATELAQWVQGHLTQVQRVHATTTLCRLGFLQHQVVGVGETGRDDQYTVTAEGLAAITEAAAGHVRKSGPKTSRAPNPLKADSLVMRVWRLVRMRGIVDSDTLARTLCDAGDEVAFARMQDSCAKYLRRWATAGALDESAKRVGATGTSNGFKRYVLKPEWKKCPEPPRWGKTAKASTSGHGGAL
ncbi:MAG: hypothetical protein E6Q67_09525 [Roseateles sp.]|nr:MAG: hypothetical protein E6Q67_09525 [Roseateles sp.]